jgi:hypothetical protein
VRWLLTVLAWALSFALLAPVCFVAVILLAGPHSSVLPALLQPVVLVFGWVVFLVAPVLIARAVWRRTGRSGSRDAVD